MGVPAGYDALTKGAGLFAQTGLHLVEVTGEDRKGWLHGQVTQDLRDFDVGRSTDACLVAATGQILAVLRLWSLPDRIVALTEVPCALIERAARFVVLEDVKAAPVEANVVSVQGPTASASLSRFTTLPARDGGELDLFGQCALALRSRRTWAGGWDLAFLGSELPAALPEIGPPVSVEAWHLATLEAGLPLFGVDTDSKTLPPELGPRFESQHVSHRKGCYMGQEVLHRLHARGHVNRVWTGLSLSGPAAPGESVSTAARPEVGRVTRCAQSPRYGWIGAAMLRVEASEPGTPVWVGGQPATVEALPFDRDWGPSGGQR